MVVRDSLTVAVSRLDEEEDEWLIDVTSETVIHQLLGPEYVRGDIYIWYRYIKK